MQAATAIAVYVIPILFFSWHCLLLTLPLVNSSSCSFCFCCKLLVQLALYDVRRLSSAASSVINFGGSRASQQLIASFNLPARADEAAAAAAAAAADGSSSTSRGHIYPFFSDVSLNPCDPNLVAYVRPDLQVGAAAAGTAVGERGGACACNLARTGLEQDHLGTAALAVVLQWYMQVSSMNMKLLCVLWCC
jgi:hypothetical protein